MKTLSLNCRGLGSATAVRALCRLLRRLLPDLVFLCETKLSDRDMCRLRSRLGFAGCIAGSANGSAGGVALLWTKNVQVQLRSFSHRHIDFEVLNNDGVSSWRGTGIYGWPDGGSKFRTWELLDFLGHQTRLPWLVFGDWNSILFPEDKWGGRAFDILASKPFHDFLSKFTLRDLGFFGPRFTWSNRRRGRERICERLDRFVASIDWCELFPMSKVEHVVWGGSDHCPIVLNSDDEGGLVGGRYSREIKFEAHWTKDVNFRELMCDTWRNTRHMKHLGRRFADCNSSFARWSRRVNGNFEVRIKEVREKLQQAMNENYVGMDDTDVAQLEKQLVVLEEKQETYWSQRAHHQYLKEGDRNTAYFHSRVKLRNRKAPIRLIRDSEGRIREDRDDISNVIFQYFCNMFTSRGNEDIEACEEVRGIMLERDKALLNLPYSRGEVEAAIKDMHPTKAPGPDGMCALFFQKYWDIVGDDVSRMVLDFLNDGTLEEGINETVIRLIPKTKNPERVQDFRPISLCNVRFKIISKVLSNRVRGCLDRLIDDRQSAFIKGRQITDNFLVAAEALHSMNHKKKGRQYMALKLDMSKAYDRVEWNFLECILYEIGLPTLWVQRAMACVRSVSYRVHVNRHLTEKIVPTRGLRQGDPLSPYLFLFCMTGLSLLIDKYEKEGLIHGIRVCRGAPEVTHLFFADDVMLFLRANIREATCLKEILRKFEVSTGQQVNFEKSEIFFSEGVPETTRNHIRSCLGVREVEKPSKYLGLPTLIGRSKEATFRVVKEKIFSRVMGYSEKLLSQAGREILIKSVLQSIPTFLMGVYRLPKSLCDDINGLLANFWWSGGDTRQKIHWVAWRKLCRPKWAGGMGFRDIQSFNEALLGKQAWRVYTRSNSLASRVLKARYFPRGTIWSAQVGFNPSYTWRSILGGRDLLLQHGAWRIGDGRTVKILGSCWLPSRIILRNDRGVASHEEMKVEALVNTETGEWDSQMVHQFFDPVIATQILHTPLDITKDDELWWPHSPDGCFTVRTGYVMVSRAAELVEGSSSGALDKFWKRFWRINAHPRILNLVWRLIWGALPVCFSLYRRKVTSELACPLCCSSIETINHLFLECTFARGIWEGLGLDMWRYLNSYGAKHWFECMFADMDEDQLSRLVYGIECIWEARNGWVFESKRTNKDFSLARALASHQKFVETTDEMQELNTSSSSDPSWSPPPSGYFKINFDAALVSLEEGVGLGSIIRDDRGVFVAAEAKHVQTRWPVSMGETAACLMGLNLARSLGLRQIHVEGDALGVINQLQTSELKRGPERLLLEQVQKELLWFDEVQFKWAKRTTNTAADRIAHIAYSTKVHEKWEVTPPVWLVDCLQV